MKAIKFAEQNITFAESQPQYTPLPALRTVEGEVISCWQLSEEELVEVQKTGLVYISQLTFNHGPLQPIYLTTKKEEIIK